MRPIDRIMRLCTHCKRRPLWKNDHVEGYWYCEFNESETDRKPCTDEDYEICPMKTEEDKP